MVAHVETTSKMAVPYCPKCVDHALWHQEQGMVGVVIRAGSAFAFGAAISAFLLMLTYSLLPASLKSVSMVGGAALLVGVLCATVVGVRRLRREPIGELDDSHAAKGPAFFLGEATVGQVALDFANDEYARRVRALSPETTSQQLRPDSHDPQLTLAEVVPLLVVLAFGIWAIFFGE